MSSVSSDKFAQWWYWDGVIYKQTDTITKPKRMQLFALIINCTIMMKTKYRFSRNVYAISDRLWCNKHLRHTTTENMIIMGKVDTSDMISSMSCLFHCCVSYSILPCWASPEWHYTMVTGFCCIISYVYSIWEYIIYCQIGKSHIYIQIC